MKTVREAQDAILERVRQFGTEEVAIGEALGRVLAEDIFSNRNHPPYDISAMDGYALPHPGVRVVTDFLPGRGPALGLASALAVVAEKSDWLFVVSCDVPSLSGELVELLAGMREGVDVVVPDIGGRLQTMCAFYSRACLAPLTERINAGRRGIGGFLKDTELSVRYVNEGELTCVDPELRRLCRPLAASS